MKQPCPKDANHDTSLFSSRERIWCHDCREYFAWPLNGQKPLIANNRQDRKEQTA
ncbi:hypothetical protein [Pseudomonas sp.]|uniref:hypothetical protein n=1 Tax=Pseudomonas sp. TaxID=306 RepID=UPI00258ED869|nr:hypothetical protein [Pseudomonas sp.]